MRFPHQFQRGEVQFLRHQRSTAQPKQVVPAVTAGGINSIGVGGQYLYRFSGFRQRGGVNAGVLGLVALHPVKEAIAGKHLRPAMGGLATGSIERGEGGCISAGGRNLKQRPWRSEKNLPLTRSEEH